MTMRRSVGTFALGVAAVALTGCMPKMTMEDLKNTKVELPPELDKLAAFAGKWESTGEVKIGWLDEVLKTTSTSTASWECDGALLVERGEFEMQELGKMSMIAISTYDPKSKKYRSWMFDSFGSCTTGTATYDEPTRTWKMKGKGRGAWGNTFSRGTVTMLDDDTAEWTFTERYGSIFAKPWEFKGTSRRK